MTASGQVMNSLFDRGRGDRSMHCIEKKSRDMAQSFDSRMNRKKKDRRQLKEIETPQAASDTPDGDPEHSGTSSRLSFSYASLNGQIDEDTPTSGSQFLSQPNPIRRLLVVMHATVILLAAMAIQCGIIFNKTKYWRLPMDQYKALVRSIAQQVWEPPKTDDSIDSELVHSQHHPHPDSAALAKTWIDGLESAVKKNGGLLVTTRRWATVPGSQLKTNTPIYVCSLGSDGPIRKPGEPPMMFRGFGRDAFLVAEMLEEWHSDRTVSVNMAETVTNHFFPMHQFCARKNIDSRLRVRLLPQGLASPCYPGRYWWTRYFAGGGGILGLVALLCIWLNAMGSSQPLSLVHLPRLAVHAIALVGRYLILYLALNALERIWWPKTSDFSDHVVAAMTNLMLFTIEAVAIYVNDGNATAARVCRILGLTGLALLVLANLYSIFITSAVFHTPKESWTGLAVAVCCVFGVFWGAERLDAVSLVRLGLSRDSPTREKED